MFSVQNFSMFCHAAYIQSTAYAYWSLNAFRIEVWRWTAYIPSKCFVSHYLCWSVNTCCNFCAVLHSTTICLGCTPYSCYRSWSSFLYIGVSASRKSAAFSLPMTCGRPRMCRYGRLNFVFITGSYLQIMKWLWLRRAVELRCKLTNKVANVLMWSCRLSLLPSMALQRLFRCSSGLWCGKKNHLALYVVRLPYLLLLVCLDCLAHNCRTVMKRTSVLSFGSSASATVRKVNCLTSWSSRQGWDLIPIKTPPKNLSLVM